MAYEWFNKWVEDNWKKQSKLGKARTAYGVGTGLFQPTFVGLYGRDVGSDLGKALRVTGFDVDPDRFAQVGGAIGALGGAASLKSPNVTAVVNPLMNAALGASLLKKYHVDEHLGSALEDLDFLHVNRNMDNISLWDRITLATSNPYMLTDLALALKDAPVAGNLFKFIPEDTYNKYASNLISGASWLRHRTLPSKYPNIVLPEHLYGTNTKGKPIGLSKTPLNDWALETLNGFINPWEWANSFVEFLNKEINPGDPNNGN